MLISSALRRHLNLNVRCCRARENETARKVDNERWRGVPFLLSAGKGLDERLCEIRVRFKPQPFQARLMQGAVGHNELVMRVQARGAFCFVSGFLSTRACPASVWGERHMPRLSGTFCGSVFLCFSSVDARLPGEHLWGSGRGGGGHVSACHG